MNHSPSGSLRLSKAITGFLSYKIAEGLAQRSVYSYERILIKWAEHVGDIQVSRITSQEISSYLSWLRTEYIPERLSGKTHPLSPKSLRNIWIAFSSFFRWASTEFNIANPMKDVPPPRFKRAPVESFTQEEVELMLKACIYTREAVTYLRHKFVMRRATANRDQAIILVLLDTGLRAFELCSLRVGDIDIKRGKVEVRHGIEGGAKGGKGRMVYLGKVARRALWRYLAEREDGEAVLTYLRGCQVIGDKGFSSADWQAKVFAWTQNQIWTPMPSNQYQQNPPALDRWLNSVRERIEGVFHELTNTGRDLEGLLAKTLVGLCTRVIA